MTPDLSAYASWDALAGPWRVAIEAAWQSYREGGIAVGAVLTDGGGAVVGEGRNRRFAGQDRGLLAHAEMGALASLPVEKDRARDSVLYTTLSPCPMCFGAVVVARVGQVHIGAMDPTWQGIERLPELSDEVQRRWPRIQGPLTGRVGVWLAVAPVLNTTGALFRAVERTEPANAVLARAVHRRYQERAALPESAVQALEDVWDLLAGASG
jgi:tRNA(Arg) A34 adenosine deaminase TadA